MVKSRGGIMATFWRNYRGLPLFYVTKLCYLLPCHGEEEEEVRDDQEASNVANDNYYSGEEEEEV
jgi:hypothetical protein